MTAAEQALRKAVVDHWCEAVEACAALCSDVEDRFMQDGKFIAAAGARECASLLRRLIQETKEKHP